jgi:hypothetical protein
MTTQDKLTRRQICKALTLFFDCAAQELSDQRYCVVGTAAAVIQGVNLMAKDIDILVEKRVAVDKVARALEYFPCIRSPIWLPDARQYFAAFEIQSALVEISTVEWETNSDCIETLGEGPYKHIERIKLGDHWIPVIRLELRLATELVRGRSERSLPLIRWLRKVGYDQPLLQRAMQAGRIPEETQVEVLKRIS